VGEALNAWWTNLRPRWQGARLVIDAAVARAAYSPYPSSSGRRPGAHRTMSSSARTTRTIREDDGEMRRALVLACLLPVRRRPAPTSSSDPDHGSRAGEAVTLPAPERQHRGERPLFALSPTRARAAEQFGLRGTSRRAHVGTVRPTPRLPAILNLKWRPLGRIPRARRRPRGDAAGRRLHPQLLPGPEQDPQLPAESSTRSPSSSPQTSSCRHPPAHRPMLPQQPTPGGPWSGPTAEVNEHFVI